ncbi:MAG: YggS family pyridoxal phosphate-dependent enzyme [Dysgonamonadaceae bacterium]|jgi:pyridoxal phosphate enzyme (YggS family)|nr:YggS family pyridoxal phosphate-dependent enzyme [Dysgonamonadaceae bacterium]
MSIAQQLHEVWNQLPDRTRLVAVSKFHPLTVIREAYDAGQRIFGESRVQELVTKYEELPGNIIWHFIGHLQTNKVKYIVPVIDMIESVDSLHLLREIDLQGRKFNRRVHVLLQIHIAAEETKFGFTFDECRQLLLSGEVRKMKNVCVCGLMGMATFTENQSLIRTEFAGLADFFKKIKQEFFENDPEFREISMGMSDDYLLAIEEGSTLVRIGSKLFGQRI